PECPDYGATWSRSTTPSFRTSISCMRPPPFIVISHTDTPDSLRCVALETLPPGTCLLAASATAGGSDAGAPDEGGLAVAGVGAAVLVLAGAGDGLGFVFAGAADEFLVALVLLFAPVFDFVPVSFT